MSQASAEIFLINVSLLLITMIFFLHRRKSAGGVALFLLTQSWQSGDTSNCQTQILDRLKLIIYSCAILAQTIMHSLRNIKALTASLCFIPP